MVFFSSCMPAPVAPIICCTACKVMCTWGGISGSARSWVFVQPLHVWRPTPPGAPPQSHWLTPASPGDVGRKGGGVVAKSEFWGLGREGKGARLVNEPCPARLARPVGEQLAQVHEPERRHSQQHELGRARSLVQASIKSSLWISLLRLMNRCQSSLAGACVSLLEKLGVGFALLVHALTQ